MLRTDKRMINKKTATYILIGVFLIALMTAIGTSAFVRILDIRVSGYYVLSEAEILEASQVSLGDNLLRINANAVSQNIRSNLPFVSDVVIERRLPDTLIIEITESIPVAFALFAGDILILDSSGRVLQRGQYSTENLIEIRGLAIGSAALGQAIVPATGTISRFTDMRQVLEAFEREDLKAYVSFLDVSNIRNINFGYREIHSVVLGSAFDLHDKLHNLRINEETFFQDRPGEPLVINVTNPAETRFRGLHESDFYEYTPDYFGDEPDYLGEGPDYFGDEHDDFEPLPDYTEPDYGDFNDFEGEN